MLIQCHGNYIEMEKRSNICLKLTLTEGKVKFSRSARISLNDCRSERNGRYCTLRSRCSICLDVRSLSKNSKIKLVKSTIMQRI